MSPRAPPASAQDGVQHLRFSYGPVKIAPGQNTINLAVNDQRPKVDGWIVGFRPDLVRMDGEPAGAVSWDVSMTVTPPDWRVQLRKGAVLRVSGTYDTKRASWYESMAIMPTMWVPGRDRQGPAHDGRRRQGQGHARRKGRGLKFVNRDARRTIFHTITACKAPCNRTTGIAYPPADDKVDFDSGELGFGPAGFTAAANRDTWTTPKNLDAGRYTYFCRVHPVMRGAFEVKPKK